jgi:gliding motility-associated-like protein
MLRQLIFILLFLPFGAISQIQSIEVCTENQEYMQEYWVDNPIPSQYEWIVGGGEIIEGQGTNNILVNWLNVPYGLYNISVSVVSNAGCIGNMVSLTVDVDECSFDNVFVPNCFTPNGDEVNNVWGPVFAGDWDHTVYNMLIFNRWGGIVWESDNHLAMWDGRYNNKMCQDGVYIWKMECKKLNTTVKEVMHGHLTLLR